MFLFPSWRKKQYSFLKDNDVWWTVLVLNLFAIPGTIIAAKLSKHLRSITPNGISVTSFVFFFLGVTLLFIRPHNNAYFTLCFFLCSVFDAMDGQLARLRHETSQLGVIVDAFFDMLNHSLGLMLVGVALSIKVDSPYPLIIILPYSLYLGVMHINCITDQVMRAKRPAKSACEEKTIWQKFCDKRGLLYYVYGDVETIYFAILIIGINLPNPWLWLLITIYLRFTTIGLRKILNVRIKPLQALLG